MEGWLVGSGVFVCCGVEFWHQPHARSHAARVFIAEGAKIVSAVRSEESKAKVLVSD
jgi:hypothetical protein